MTIRRRPGYEVVMELPTGYDDRTRLCVFRMVDGEHDRILMTHPDHPPVILDMEQKTFLPLIP